MTIRRRCKVGEDGNVTVPVGRNEAGADVDVVISTIPRPSLQTMTDDEWRAFVARTAGSIEDETFRRHDQGELEDRLPLE
jgi:hypothetical protein